MQKYIIVLLSVLLASCNTPAPVIKSGGMEYKQDGRKIALDVADIQVVNAYDADPSMEHNLLPTSIVTAIQDWASTRFVTTGTKGTATIKIVNAAVSEKNLMAPKDVHMLLNPQDQPMEYGVNVMVEISVQDTPSYTEGKVQTSLSRHVTMDSDVVLGFNPDIWTAFLDNLINSLDHQMLVNIKTYLPNILASASAGSNALS